MDDQKYPVGSLVIFRDEIHELIEVIQSDNKLTYKIELRAFLRELKQSDWVSQIKPYTMRTVESELKPFTHPKPCFTFGERLLLKDNRCIVKFIRFNQYHYLYDVMRESYWGGINSGWTVEESYLSK